jgi:hypothetical protein
VLSSIYINVKRIDMEEKIDKIDTDQSAIDYLFNRQPTIAEKLSIDDPIICNVEFRRLYTLNQLKLERLKLINNRLRIANSRQSRYS